MLDQLHDMAIDDEMLFGNVKAESFAMAVKEYARQIESLEFIDNYASLLKYCENYIGMSEIDMLDIWMEFFEDDEVEKAREIKIKAIINGLSGLLRDINMHEVAKIARIIDAADRLKKACTASSKDKLCKI